MSRKSAEAPVPILCDAEEVCVARGKAGGQSGIGLWPLDLRVKVPSTHLREFDICNNINLCFSSLLLVSHIDQRVLVVIWGKRCHTRDFWRGPYLKKTSNTQTFYTSFQIVIFLSHLKLNFHDVECDKIIVATLPSPPGFTIVAYPSLETFIAPSVLGLQIQLLL